MVESTGHGSEEVFIHNDVILRADVASLGIQHPAHGGRMTWRGSKIDALVASWLKFW